MYYTVQDKIFNPCRYYNLVQGCYDEIICGGVSYITILGRGPPTSIPSGEPSGKPSSIPTSPSSEPSGEPSSQPTNSPTNEPTSGTGEPSSTPTTAPSSIPSSIPTSIPTDPRPTSQPSNEPVVDNTATILITVMLPFSSILFVVCCYATYRYYTKRYTYSSIGNKGGGRGIHSHKIHCQYGESNAYTTKTNTSDNILTQIDFYEDEF